MPSPPSLLRTLVIDDDEMSRDLLTILLEAEGHAVDSANSGDAALTQLDRSRRVYDVILTDLQMPGIAGPALARQLRHVCGPQPLLLAISGSQPRAEALAPFDDFLLKPFPATAVTDALLKRASDAESHQSRTLSAIPNTFSIAAAASDQASYDDMSLPTQEHVYDVPAPFASQSTVSCVMDHPPALNEQIYHQLVGSMPPQQLQEMYALCINDARKRIARMRQMIAERDGAAVCTRSSRHQGWLRHAWCHRTASPGRRA